MRADGGAPGYGALFLRFLRFGLLAWGGPVAQIAMVKRELVDEEKWLSPDRFNRLLAVYQVLPGPEAHELCVHLGMMKRGRLGGLLAGYIELRPKQGWDLAVDILRDSRRPFPDRMAVLGTLRFYHGWKSEQVRNEVVRGLGVLLEQGDIADMAINDLRTWQYWDLTADVLAQYGKKTHDAPLMRIRECVTDIAQDRDRVVDRQWSISSKPCSDRRAGLVWHHVIRSTVTPVLHVRRAEPPGIVQRHDVRVPQLCRDLDLT